MFPKRIAKRFFLFLGILMAPAVYSTDTCQGFTKEVSVDGGVTWFDADNALDAPEQVVGGLVEYRFIVKNCETNKNCIDTSIEDLELGIPSTLLPGNPVITPGQEIIITSADAGFGNLAPEDRCDTPGLKFNVATETTTVVGSSASESFNDSAYVNCVESPPVKLGDRVWEDFDRDGDQDCLDSNGNGIIGDAGDSGAECGAGIPFIPVDLFEGDCMTALTSTVTDGNGFYHFNNLIPDNNYCVRFHAPPEDFCDTTDLNGDVFKLGAPKFTAKDAGGSDATDSDADPTSGLTDPISLGSDDNITIDAGIYCPAKIGNLVFLDENEDGVQNSGDGVVAGVKTTLFECGPDMIAGTDDDVMTDEMRFTDESGMYMYGAEPGYDLPPGKYFVKFDRPLGFDFTTPNVGPDGLDSDCRVPDGITACTDLTRSRSINLDRDCGLTPPPPPNCDLTLDKQCRVEAPPPQPFDKCDGKLQQFTLLWTGAGPITASGPNNSVNLSTGNEATFVGPFDNNDVIVNISGAANGQSKFHVSCSDEDFNDPSDCGKLAGNGKSNDSGLINDWRLEGFIDKEGRVLDCNPDSGGDGFADNCTFEPQPLPSCDNGEKPDNLTWRYDGGTGGDGDCADSTFFTIVNEDGKMHQDFECSGSVNTGLQITAVDDDGNAFTVNPGESFTTLRDDSKTITLTDSMGNTQELVFHTSCSQPLEAQATAGALTLAALDGRDGAQDVTYRYDVGNTGDPLTNVSIEDNQLGTIASGFGLDSGTGASFDVMTQIFGTTTNTAFASGTLADGKSCSPESAADSVTIEAVIPPCSLGVEARQGRGRQAEDQDDEQRHA